MNSKLDFQHKQNVFNKVGKTIRLLGNLQKRLRKTSNNDNLQIFHN